MVGSKSYNVDKKMTKPNVDCCALRERPSKLFNVDDPHFQEMRLRLGRVGSFTNTLFVFDLI